MEAFLKTMRTKLEKQNIKSITIDGYMNSLTKIRTNVKSKSIGIKYFKLTDKILTYLDTIKNTNTRLNLMKPILNLLKREPKLQDTYQIYLSKFNEWKLINNKDKGENKFTEKELKDKVEWKDIVNIKPKKLNDKIFLSLLVNDNLFLRLAFFSIKLDEYNTTTDNYIDGPFLFMNDFKNVKTLGPQKFNLSDKTTDIIKEIKGSWLMSNHNLTNPNKSAWVKRIFNKYLKKSVNNNLLRKIYINHILLNKPKLSNNEIDKLARKMLNTRATWEDTYRKVN